MELKFNYLFDIKKFNKLINKYNKKYIQDIFEQIKVNYYVVENKIFYENINNKNDIYDLTPNILYISDYLTEYLNVNDLLKYKILIIDDNLSILQSLKLILKNKINYKKITNIITGNHKNINNIKKDEHIKIFNSNKLFIDDIFLNNNKKYDFILISNWIIEKYYYNLLFDSNINNYKRIILWFAINNFYLIRFIKLVTEKLNKNGNVLFFTSGIINKQLANIISLFSSNFEDYTIDYNDSIVNLYNINDILSINILLKGFKKKTKINNEINNIYNYYYNKPNINKFLNNEIKNIDELIEFLKFDYSRKINSNNIIEKKIMLLINKKIDKYNIKYEQINMILNNKIKKEILQKEIIIIIIRLIEKFKLTIDNKYKLSKCMKSYNNNLFAFFSNIEKHYHKIKNNKFNIKIIKPKINTKHWILQLINKYDDTRFLLKLQNIKIYNQLLNKINKHNTKILESFNKNNNYIKLTNNSLEMYEILTIVNLFTNKQINILHLNEYNGTNVSAFNNFIKNKTKIKKYNWNCQTFRPGLYFGNNNDIITYDDDDIFNILDLEPNKWDFYNNGDITELDTMNYYFNNYKKINLITINNNIYNDTIYLLKQLFCYIVFSLNILNKNGNMLFTININSLRYSSIISLLSFLSTKFHKILVYKSNINIIDDNFYVICINYNKRINNNEFNQLFKFTKHFDINKEIINLKTIKDKMKYNIMFSINKIIQNHIFNLNRIINFTSNYEILTNKEKNKIIKMLLLNNKEWIDEFHFNH